ncbi:hypothetical protein SERLA73DRAFT_101356 [Serpula lacrymans var. lacrymans S7.3]|uniref:DUF2264 domain-containing protein n=2 Tax=Serpula lacrymans var. lacrymans TaxID=341189 RepID=F8PK08_SERL3|nr:uncharacterized protein SERLADRAFT_444917 [Serpula lacrymans var. lacrymans S7.9]EGO03248.1 hypothetical protein SERLA73DRAFT_101356 [Serpula lacrymans var. lacrymans S7.3]EGO29031.1 hypothetical protein SERLADRAFT_444917 [Serpula lacrymans var. lacrymans S7.9]
MDPFAGTRPWGKNPLETKNDLANFLVNVLDPLGPHTSPGGARIHLGHTATHYDEAAAQLEGFSRPIWGLAALLAGGGSYEGTKRWVDGFSSGTNPDHEEFWGDMRNKDQRMVECSAIGFSLAVAREKLWDPLDDASKKNFESWLGGMNDKEMPNTNWLWFRVFANLGLSKVGSPRFDAKRMKADLDHLDTFYIGEGWSRDGPEGVIQLDYYSSSFAIQFAQLVYSKLAQAEDPQRCEEYRNRARRFAQDFIRYFDAEGRAIPFGRSMTYRFAMSSFWGALAFADVELPAPLTWGVIKGLQLRNIRYWMRQPGAYYPDGTLTIGFVYPNHNMTENYNSPGSPYWCCKSFVTLALPDSHPFWTSKEEPYPSKLLGTTAVLHKPLHIATNVGGHTFLLSSGQQCSYPVKQSAAKYGKLAYSSAFGYSVPVGNGTLEELGGDNTLALSDDNGETWKCRRDTREARIENGKWLRSMWYPWKDVEVETWLVPPTLEAPLWHLRVHRIKTGRDLTSAEGGFAIYGQREDGRALEPAPEGKYGTYEEAGEARATSKAGVSGIADIGSTCSRNGQALRTDANSNLIVARAVLPTLVAKHKPDSSNIWLLTAVFGLPNEGDAEGPAKGWEVEWRKRPSVPGDIRL